MNKKYSNFKKVVIFWFFFLIVIFVIFLLFQNRILYSLGKTHFFEQVFGSEPAWLTEKIAKAMPPEEKNVENEIELESPLDVVIENQKSISSRKDLIEKDEAFLAAIEPIKKRQPEVVKEETKDKTENPLETIKKDEEKSVIAKEPIKNEIKTEKKEDQKNLTEKTKLLLCFVIIDGDGTVIRKEIERAIPKTTTPLTEAIHSLLQGPTISELETGSMTLIPQGTKLIGASVKNRTATLNFNEEFINNRYGVEGYIGQLMQIVYTATTFSSIDNVQFLIDGQRREYLGSEGVWIGTPLARSTFR